MYVEERVDEIDEGRTATLFIPTWTHALPMIDKDSKPAGGPPSCRACRVDAPSPLFSNKRTKSAWIRIIGLPKPEPIIAFTGAVICRAGAGEM